MDERELTAARTASRTPGASSIPLRARLTLTRSRVPGLAASASTALYSAIDTGAGPMYRVLASAIWSLRLRPCFVSE